MLGSLDDLQERTKQLKELGYTIVSNALSAEAVVAARAAVVEVLEQEDEVARRTGTQTDNLRNAHVIVGKHPLFHEFFLNPPVMAVVNEVLGDDAFLYDGNIRVPMPTGERDGRKGFQVHVDREDYAVRPFAGGRHFPMALNVVWCLTDFTVENGTTSVWPGSHLSGEVPDPEQETSGAIQVEAPAGSAIAWDAALWHQGGVNHSDAPRWCVIGYYQRAWIKGKTDTTRVVPPEAIEQMSENAKRLLGIVAAPSDYSEVKALTVEQIEALTLEEKKVLGFAVY
jgi:ectoine hydroxylase-related dioxygenase (phytanoyl-CoA dioxygenase family)